MRVHDRMNLAQTSGWRAIHIGVVFGNILTCVNDEEKELKEKNVTKGKADSGNYFYER